MSKYYLMHKFKEQTGYTIHNYIIQKRLIMSNLLIKKGRSITDACMESGFNDYSNFSRAFKKIFMLSPKEYYKKFHEVGQYIYWIYSLNGNNPGKQFPHIMNNISGTCIFKLSGGTISIGDAYTIYSVL